MDDKNINQNRPFGDTQEEGTPVATSQAAQNQESSENVEWGQNHQERISDNSSRHHSGHACKGPTCDKGFDKF